MTVRNWKRKALATIAAGGVVSLSMGDQVAADITTTLAGANTGINNQLIPLGHGDTAEATVVWDADGLGDPLSGGGAWQTYTGWPNDPGNDVYQIDGNDVAISFTPTSGQISVSIDSFDINVWPGGGETNIDWFIHSGTNSSGALLAQGTVAAVDGAVTNVAPLYSGANGEALTLRMLRFTGIGSYTAMDNLTFRTTVSAVPEPGSATALAVGLGALLLRRRKR